MKKTKEEDLFLMKSNEDDSDLRGTDSTPAGEEETTKTKEEIRREEEEEEE